MFWGIGTTKNPPLNKAYGKQDLLSKTPKGYAVKKLITRETELPSEPFLTISAYKRRLQLLLVGDYLIRNTLGNKTITSSEMFEYQTDIQSNKLTIP